MAEKVTNKNLVLGGVTKTVITPYDKTTGELSADYYTLMSCVENTTAITQEEGSSTDILNEQKGVIKSIPSPGTRSFTTESGDIQENILVGLLGYHKAVDGAFVAPVGDPGIEAKVEVYFQGGEYKATCYKVALVTSLTIESMSEGIARGVIGGKLIDTDVSENGTPDIRAFAIEPV